MAKATPYSTSFYDGQSGGSKSSADVVTPFILDIAKPKSVVDVGCGVGTWLRAYQERGVDDILGFDGEWALNGGLRIDAANFRAADLSNPPAVERRFDLAQSLEVAEHLDAAHAPGFVDFLTSLADVIVFSAALPHQGGTHHVNERWASYWRDLFAARDYEMYDLFRPRFWDHEDVEWWYAQNLYLYVKRGVEDRVETDLEAARGFVFPERIVHPSRIDPVRTPIGLRDLLSELPGAVARRFNRT